jgi:3-dehydroquinate synthase
LQDITQHILLYFPKQNIEDYPIQNIIQLMLMDKKNKGNDIQAALLSKIGQCSFDICISEQEILDSINFYINL